MIITNSRYALVGYFITSYPTRAHGIIVNYTLQIILNIVNIHLVRYSFAKTYIYCDAEEPCEKCSRVVAIVPYSTIGLSLVSEAPARLRFEPSIVCFDLLISVLSGITK